jgi:thymidine kinase
MTPKEKADQLVNDMQSSLYSDGWEDSKQCALIAVDEIIKFEESIINQLDKITKSAKREFIVQKKYWEGVKSEIEKL